MTYIEGTVENLHNGKKGLTVYRFLVDTGASISVLNSSFGFLFVNTPVIDTVSLRYEGSNAKALPVYSIRLKIKGISFELLAAFDENMKITSILGHYAFLNNFEHLGISKLRKKLTLIK